MPKSLLSCGPAQLFDTLHGCPQKQTISLSNISHYQINDEYTCIPYVLQIFQFSV